MARNPESSSFLALEADGVCGTKRLQFRQGTDTGHPRWEPRGLAFILKVTEPLKDCKLSDKIIGYLF